MTQPPLRRPSALRSAFVALSVLLAVPLLGAAGCSRPQEAGAGPPIARGEPPAYSEVAARHNERAARLGRLWGRAAVQIRYTDDEGQRRFDQGEGHVSVEQPARLALSVGKLGETLLWLGGDEDRYWWIEPGSGVSKAFVGRYDGPALARSPIMSAANARVLILLMGVSLLPTDPDAGVTQWSDNGRLLGVTTRLAEPLEGYQRFWLDPRSYAVVKAELYNEARQVVVAADLTDEQFVRVVGEGRVGPTMAGKVFAGHEPTELEVRLFMSGLTDDPQRLSPRAFEFESVVADLGVSEVVDLDARAADADATAPAAPPAP